MKMPGLVFLNITNECSLACRHCYFASGRPLADELKTTQWLAVVRQLANAGVQKVRINGGEPTLSHHLMPILDEILKFKMSASVTTNGQVLDVPGLQRLANKCAVHFSLDGASEATHDFLRDCPGAFSRTLSSIQTVTEKRDDVRCFIAIGTHNVHEINDLVQLVDRLNVSIAAFFHMSPFGRAQENIDLIPSPKLWEKCLSALKKAVADQKPKTRIFCEPVYEFAEPTFCSMVHGRLCSIDPRGDVYTCSALIDGTSRFALGNIVNSDLSSLWTDHRAWSRLREEKLLVAKNSDRSISDCSASILRQVPVNYLPPKCFMTWTEVEYG